MLRCCPLSCCQCWNMRTCVLRVHLTSLTLILVITVSGQEGVSRDDTGGYILHCSRSLITPVLLARTLLVRYFIMCSYVTGSFFVLLLSLRTENEMLWCVALTGWDRDVEEVKITFIHSAFPPPSCLLTFNSGLLLPHIGCSVTFVICVQPVAQKQPSGERLFTHKRR